MAKVGQDYIYRYGAQAETRTAISTKNKVYSFIPGQKSQFFQIGVMSSFGLSESRPIEPVRGIGYGDQIAELVPGVTEPLTISVERTMLYLAQMMQIFGYKAGIDGIVRSLKHHRWPFDIKQELTFSELADKEASGQIAAPSSGEGQGGQPCTNALITLFEACWMSSYNTTFAADTTIVTESCDISVSDILDFRTASGGDGGYGECLDSGNDFTSRRFGAGTAVAK